MNGFVQSEPINLLMSTIRSCRRPRRSARRLQLLNIITGAQRNVCAQKIDWYETRWKRLLLESFSRPGPIVAPIWDDLGIPRA